MTPTSSQQLTNGLTDIEIEDMIADYDVTLRLLARHESQENDSTYVREEERRQTKAGRV